MPTKRVQIGGRSVTLDARADRLDLRDLPYRARLGNLPARYPLDSDVAAWLPAYADAGLVLDQGEEGACTGFGLAAVVNYLLFTREGGRCTRKVSPAMLYELARMYDEWPGEDYEGSSCRGALKGWHRHGVCRDTLWPYYTGRETDPPRSDCRPKEDAADRDDAERNWDVDALQTTLGVYYRVDLRSVVDIQSAIFEAGAVYVSATVHEGWTVPERKRLRGHADLAPIKHVPKPKDGGGHAFALVGYNERGFVVQNSWGPDWGSRGFALLPYEDWVMHGDDCWVFTLGVPRQLDCARSAAASRGIKGAQPGRQRTPRFYLPPSKASNGATLERPVGLVGAEDALDRRYRSLPPALRPLEADEAYRYTVVLDRGFPVRNDITATDPLAELNQTVCDRALAWLQANGSRKLMLYAHGGLNSEGDSITRIRAIAPYCLANGIYPLFVTWRTGGLETVTDLVEEFFARLGLGARGTEPVRGWADRLLERTDRLLETMLRGPGSALWEQMKLNAARAGLHGKGGTRMTVEALSRLAQRLPGLEIHLVGHSAGSIVLGAMLPSLQAAGLRAHTLRLFAPACTLRFALDHYRPAVAAGVIDPRHWHIHVLSDKNEQDDCVGPYRKSLLYLVSRSFEEHKTPLLGMDRAFDASTALDEHADEQWSRDLLGDVREWQAFWAQCGVDASNRHVLAATNVPTAPGTSTRASHGCFDNAIDLVGQALGYVIDRDAPRSVKVVRLDY